VVVPRGLRVPFPVQRHRLPHHACTPSVNQVISLLPLCTCGRTTSTRTTRLHSQPPAPSFPLPRLQLWQDSQYSYRIWGFATKSRVGDSMSNLKCGNSIMHVIVDPTVGARAGRRWGGQVGGA